MKLLRSSQVGSIVIAAISLLCSAPLPAASISWQTPADITSDADISNIDGSSTLYAYYFTPNTGSAASTVNSVIFQPFFVPSNGSESSITVGNVSITGLYAAFTSQTPAGAPGDFSNLSSEYQSILNGIACNLYQVNLTLGGLTPEQTYLFQYWVNYSSMVGYIYNTSLTLGSASTTLAANPSGQNGGVGQYVIGTLTTGAGETSATITLMTTQDLTSVNALQVRTVPEPGPECWSASGHSSSPRCCGATGDERAFSRCPDCNFPDSPVT